MPERTLSLDPASVNSPFPLDSEVFRDIPSFPDYQASNLGRTRSCRKYFLNPEGQWRIIKPLPNNHRYSYMYIKPRRDGKSYSCRVCRLVLEAFVGPCPPGMQACHNNGNTYDDRLTNLRWDTPKANCADKRKHGTQPMGDDCTSSKLTSVQVRQIRAMAYLHYPLFIIAARYGVARTEISRIAQNLRWKEPNRTISW